MICPHCNRTIAEQDRYLMSADENAPTFQQLLAGEGEPSLRLIATLGSLAVAFCLALGWFTAIA